MHRFFMVHPFQRFVKEFVAIACLFLSCKVNDMPRLLSSFHRYLHSTFSTSNENNSTTEQIFTTYNQQIIDYENILLSTLGFSLQVDQPYLIIKKMIKLFSISPEIGQNAFDIVTKSIFFTHFSMKYTTNLIACFALHLALISSNLHIADNNDGSQWFQVLNEEFTEEILQKLVDEYRSITTKETSKIFEKRFEQIRKEKETSSNSQMKFKSTKDDHQTSDLDFPLQPNSTLTNVISNGNLPIQSTHLNGFSSEETLSNSHQTPTRSSSFHHTQINYSSPVMINDQYSQPSLPLPPLPPPQQQQQQQQLAKPIPTLMSTSNSIYPRHSTRFAPPTFKYPISTPTTSQYYYRPPYYPITNHPYSLPPSTTQQNYLSTSTIYYPQQQTPLFYHPPTMDPSAIHPKRYGEPPAPPTKRLRYHIPIQQPF